MKPTRFCAALFAACLAAPMPALGDDPLDPEMQTRAARERDAAFIRKLNLDMLAIVKERDAKQAQGWRDYELFQQGMHPDQIAYNERQAQYQAQLADYEASRASYLESQRAYRLAMEDWRRNVTACRAGEREACSSD